MRTIVALGVGLGLVAGCGGKAPVEDLDYGFEGEAVSKADSATRPARLVPLALDRVGRGKLTATERFLGFTFAGTAGQRVDLLADGLGDLDTVLSLYKVSPTTGRPYGRPLVSNDDTSKATWTLLSNGKPNPNSSSVRRFALPSTGSYALVVTSYGQRGVGDVEVRVRRYSTARYWTECDAAAAARRFSFPAGVPDADSVLLEFESEAIAERYADPEGHSVKWIVKEGEDATTERWVWGFNDLWAVRFTVARATCATTVTGEH